MRSRKGKISSFAGALFSALAMLGFFLALVLANDTFRKYSFNQNDRDPFQPLISKSGLILIPQEMDFTGLTLSGIIYSEGSALAIINSELLNEGEAIGDYTILKIEKEKVILKKNNETFILNAEEE